MANLINPFRMSVVLAGKAHNPSILNPDFLWRNRIVPESVRVLASDNISTPVMSQCSFQNGLQIHSEPDRIIFASHTLAENNPEANDGYCYAVAEKYLRVVPLVDYVVVGINFSGTFSDTKNKIVPYNLLKSGKWSKFEKVTPSAEIKLTYPLSKRIFNLDIKQGLLLPEKQKAVVWEGNFHYDIQVSQGKSYLAAIDILGGWKDDLDCLSRLVENIHQGIQE